MGDNSGTASGSAVGSLAVERDGDSVPDVAVDNGGLARLIPHFRRLCGEVAAIEAAHAVTRERGFSNTFDALAALDSERRLLADILEGTPLARDGGSNADRPITVPPDKHPERREAADREAVRRAKVYLQPEDPPEKWHANLLEIDGLAESVIPLVKADKAVPLMRLRVLTHELLGEERFLTCQVCGGEPERNILEHDRQHDPCEACDGAGEIEVEEAK